MKTTPPTKSAIDALNDQTYTSRVYLVNYLACLLRDHLPGNHPVRFHVNAELPRRDGNGDSSFDMPQQAIENVFNLFGSMPVEDQKRVLNGWDPRLLHVDFAENAHFATHSAMAPCVLVNSLAARTYLPTEPLRACADGHFFDFGPVQISIRLGLTKGEAMDLLRNLVHQIDDQWDRIITEPADDMDGTAQAKDTDAAARAEAKTA